MIAFLKESLAKNFLPRFLERKLGKELSAKLRFASAPVRKRYVGVTFYVAPTFFAVYCYHFVVVPITLP